MLEREASVQGVFCCLTFCYNLHIMIATEFLRGIYMNHLTASQTTNNNFNNSNGNNTNNNFSNNNGNNNNINNNIDTGRLQINITSGPTSFPVAGATISISYTGVPGSTLEQVQTNSSGQTEVLELDAPPIELSLNPNNEVQPYSEYTLDVTAPGFEPVSISGTEILADVTALQNITMQPSEPQETGEEVFVIPAHTLYGEYPPKIPEAEIKPLRETGEIVLSRVVVPEYIVVHDGTPNDPTARDYYVKYKDYIKNVASSEIYATWPANTIRSNVLAIMSFTLNRVYTEWYRNQGYDFTITSSTAFDHKWIPERNYYDNISEIVDELFTNYLSRPNVRQPILTQYCDGNRVSCPGWMTQWGSKSLGIKDILLSKFCVIFMAIICISTLLRKSPEFLLRGRDMI